MIMYLKIDREKQSPVLIIYDNCGTLSLSFCVYDNQFSFLIN